MRLVIDYLNDREFRLAGNATLGETLTLKVINLPVDANTLPWSWEQRKNPGGYPQNWDSGTLLQSDTGTGDFGTVTFNPDWDAAKQETWFATIQLPLSLSLDLVLNDLFSMSLVFSGERAAAIYLINQINQSGSGQTIIENQKPIITAEKKLVNNKGTWNASTNVPDISASNPREGDFYTVSVAGSTSLVGRTDWVVGEAVYFDGENWKKAKHITVGKNNKLVDVDTADYANDTIALETALRMLDRNGNYRSVLDIVDSLTCPVDVDFEDYNNYRITSSTGAKIDLGRTVQWRIVRFNNLVIDNLWIDTDHIDRNDRAFLIGDGTNLMFDSNFIQNGAYGIFIGASDNVEVSDMKITNNVFEAEGRNDTIGGGQFGWLGKVKNVTILGNTINTRLLQPDDEFTGDPISGVTVVDDVVTAVNPVIAYVAAINLVGQENFIISANKCRGGIYAGFEKSPHKNVIISGNHIEPAEHQLFARLEVLTWKDSPESLAQSENINITANTLDYTKIKVDGAEGREMRGVNISNNYVKGKGKYYQYSASVDPAEATYGQTSNDVALQAGLKSYAGIVLGNCIDSIVNNNIMQDCRIGVLAVNCDNLITNTNVYTSNAKALDYSQSRPTIDSFNNKFVDVDTEITKPSDGLTAPALHFDFNDQDTLTNVDNDNKMISVNQVAGSGALTLTTASAVAAPSYNPTAFGVYGGAELDVNQEFKLSAAFTSPSAYASFVVLRSYFVPKTGETRTYFGDNGTVIEALSNINLAARAFSGGSSDTSLQWLDCSKPTIVAITRNASNIMSGYINSTTPVSMYSGTAQPGTRSIDTLGNKGDGTFDFKGAIAEWKVYNSELTSDQIESTIKSLAEKYGIELRK